MTTLARLYAQHDGTGTLTIGERTETVAAEDLDSVLEQLLALVVAEAKSLGHDVDVVAQLEGSPRTGLRVEWTGQIAEDPRVLARSLTRSTPPPPAHTATRTRRAKRAAPAPTIEAGEPGARARRSGAGVRGTPRHDHRRTGLAASIAALTLLGGTGLWSVLDQSEEPSAATQASSVTPTPIPTPAPSTASTQPTPAPPQLRIRAIGDQAAARFRLSADQRLTVRLRLWPRGDAAAARSRSVRLRPDNPAVVTVRRLVPGAWRWVIDIAHDSSLAPVRGQITVIKVSARPTSTATPAPTPTTTATPEPTTTSTPQPTQQPTRQPTKNPTSGGGNGDNGPGGDGPVDPGDGGPVDPG